VRNLGPFDGVRSPGGSGPLEDSGGRLVRDDPTRCHKSIDSPGSLYRVGGVTPTPEGVTSGRATAGCWPERACQFVKPTSDQPGTAASARAESAPSFDGRRSYLDAWAARHASRIRRALDDERETLTLRLGGRNHTAAPELLHDALSRAYVELAEQLSREPSWGLDADGRPLPAAVEGQGNLRMGSRLIDEFRRASSAYPLDDSDRKYHVEHARPADRRLECLAALQDVATLPAVEREALIGAVIGLECSELARALEVTPEAARQRVSRARRRLVSRRPDDGRARYTPTAGALSGRRPVITDNARTTRRNRG